MKRHEALVIARKKLAEMRPSVSERFFSHVEKTDSCWFWDGALSNGYGSIQVGGRNGKRIAAHRYSYELVRGSIPDGLQLDHLCRVRNCVNPDHLEAVTQRENLLRGEGFVAKQARQTHCIHGHPLSGNNLYTSPTRHRVCIECRKAGLRRWYKKKKQAEHHATN